MLLEGVLIPAYAINAIINKIPLLGQIITGIEGEGIIGFDYKVSATMKILNTPLIIFSLNARNSKKHF